MTEAIAIVGMACCYPDARSPTELWENVLAERRAFRQIPSQRLRLADYYSADRNEPDRTYSSEGCFIEGYEFDRERFRVSGSAFRSADLAHWLALDVASMSLDDALFSNGEGLPKETTGVFLGNTLTGEFSRSNSLRLRWPYVRRVLGATLQEQGTSPQQQRLLLERCEEVYKKPFPAISEDTLAGNLSNTIAGRICNHFDLNGGGYTVDGACASSLLAVTTACSGLAVGDLDVALAGGVDLSLDPFELVGFAKAGALAAGQMRVYDSRSNGFLPGEGCGFLVLMRLQDALERSSRIYAVIRGWGVSSDGNGGITRPEVDGQLLALQRAYKRAGFGIETVGYFEGHGTGTSVGDATEIKALTLAHRNGDRAFPAVIGSVKANIGHAKAAAGMAGLIKAAMAVHTQMLPPTTGCQDLIPELSSQPSTLRVLRKAQVWPADATLRAGISGMGFGGINTHVAIEGIGECRRHIDRKEQILLSSSQDVELFLLCARDHNDLLEQTKHLLTFASRISYAEMTDLAAQMAKEVGEKNDSSRTAVRAAVVARTPSRLVSRLEILKSWLTDGVSTRVDARTGVFLGSGVARIGFLFPGQASPVYLDGGAFSDRFDCVKETYSRAEVTNSEERSPAEITQRAIVTASIAGVGLLESLGITAAVAVGHSLGEVAALRWAGAFDDWTCLRIASARAAAMDSTRSPIGGMAAITASQQEVEALLNGDPVVIACLNSPQQTVVSGASPGVDRFLDRVRARGFAAASLSVSHAFHSPLLASAGPVLAGYLALEEFQALTKKVVSTVTGSLLSPSEDLRRLLYQQLVAPVRFIEAMNAASLDADLFVEVGPGRVLSGLASEFLDRPVIPLDMGGNSLEGLLMAVGAAYVAGAAVEPGVLFADRFSRAFDIDWQPRFFTNPCELAPVSSSSRELEQSPPPRDAARVGEAADFDDFAERSESSGIRTQSVFELLRHLIAGRTELPSTAIREEDRLLGDLHLNSITVSQLVAEASRHLGLPPSISPTDYSNLRIIDVAQALEELARTGSSSRKIDRSPSGIDHWTRCFEIKLVEQPRSSALHLSGESDWKLFVPPHHPLVESLKEAFDTCPGTGIVVALPPEMDERFIGLLLDGARAVISNKRAETFVLVQHGRGASAFARTLHLEAPWITTCVVNVPVDHSSAVEWVVEEARAASRYVEAHYDSSGKRRVPMLRLLSPLDKVDGTLLDSSDLILVSGGGKGIAAESAMSLALETGARLALLGRSEVAEDAELAANLDRFAKMGIVSRYFAADVTDAEAVRKAVVSAEAEFGPVTAILHGAGANEAKLIESLDEESFGRTLSPKLHGARNLLAAIDPDRLRVFVTFGSLIARTGMRGEADYAVANEWLTELTEAWREDHPHCRCLAVEWSAWTGAGMVQRLGRVDALINQGITPIPVDEGVRILRGLLSQPSPVSVVVTGRFGDAPTLKMEQPDLPLRRFLEQPGVYYPGIELIADSEISVQTDPYLDDHVFNGDRLFPAVMALEAMAQTAMALLETTEAPVFEDVSFNRPLVIQRDDRSILRVVALVRDGNVVETAIRSDQTGFQVDHCRAICRFNAREPDFTASFGGSENLLRVSIEPERDLYGGLLFHEGRFQRVRGYHSIRATGCVVEVEEATANWFGPYLPGGLELGDPGRRDASIHSIQVCVPNGLLLPVSIERLVIHGRGGPGLCRVEARERSRDGDLFTYDVEVRASDGSLLEKWEALRLQLVKGTAFRGPWVEPLLAPYLERFIQESFQRTDVSIAIERDGGGDRRPRSDRAIQRALGVNSPITRRPDGKPEVQGCRAVSASHCGDLTMATAAREMAACDIEKVTARPVSSWKDMLGPERYRLSELISESSGDGPDVAATRVWTAIECLKKADMPPNAPLVFSSNVPEGWVFLSSGRLMIGTLVAPVRSASEPFVFSILLSNRPPEVTYESV